MVRVPPSVWPPHTQLLSIGTPVGWAGEKWLFEWLLGGVTGRPELDSIRRGSGARDTRAWWGPHYREGFFRRMVHRFLAEEVCTSSDVGRGARSRRRSWRRPCLHQSWPPRCRPPRQWSGRDLSNDRGEKGTPCAGGPGKLDRRDALDDLQQAAGFPWPAKALYWLSVRLRGRPGGGAWELGDEDHLHKLCRVPYGEHQVARRQCPLRI